LIRNSIAGLILTLVLLASPTAMAQTLAPAAASQETTEPAQQTAETQHSQAIRKLLTIKQALENKRERVRNLLEQLAAADDSDREGIAKQIATDRQTIVDLELSFENIAVSGANLRALADSEDSSLDWRDELVQIARPLLDGLKDATEKPRRIEELRRLINLQEQQLEVIRKAIASIALLAAYQAPPVVSDGLARVAATWRERSMDVERSLENSRDELNNLESEDFKVFETMAGVLQEFALGRGLTLLLALVTAVGLWFVMRLLRQLIDVRRASREGKERAARIRLLLYGYHLLTIVLVGLAVLSVFYVRGDLLLLSLAIIALIMLAVGVWRFLPGYIMEARLLINMGAAREGERTIYNGIPFRIVSLNLYSYLRNPELDGAIRLPLPTLAQLTSRPSSDEAWFPCSVGDYLLLPGGGFGQVLQQTVELVRLKMVGSIVQYATSDFLQINARNLSREGFAVVVVFGVDYQHQDISLDLVPERLRSGLAEAFEHAGFGSDLVSLLVDFKEAGSNSLDYLIYATMDSRSAASYFVIARLIQQTCVDICNREAWVIPFAQLTIHQAEAGVPGDP
jgi:hypothetical protein